jgi:hypothetical protein
LVRVGPQDEAGDPVVSLCNLETSLLPFLILLATDTLHAGPTLLPVVFDGNAGREEYGVPALELPRPAGTALVWLSRDDRYVYLAASIPDSTSYWGDGLAISLDTKGDRADGPMHDDFLWEFRRLLDSSVVYRGEGGHWRAPRDDPDWRLGAEREGGGWEVRSTSTAAGWMVELRLDVAYFGEARPGRPGLAFRLFDDQSQSWLAWPEGNGRKHPSEVERHPSDWATVVLD